MTVPAAAARPRHRRVSGDGGQLTFRDLGTLHISYDLDGVPLGQQDAAHVADAFRDTKLIGADLRWGRRLVDRAVVQDGPRRRPAGRSRNCARRFR
ncbi:MAG: hypothetical protein WDN04_23270 [Rhodospirillales bacterium]